MVRTGGVRRSINAGRLDRPPTRALLHGPVDRCVAGSGHAGTEGQRFARVDRAARRANRDS